VATQNLDIKMRLLLYCFAACFALARAYAPLSGVTVSSVGKDGITGKVDIGEWLKASRGAYGGRIGSAVASASPKSMIVFGTYAADFNAVEYGQRLRYYWPALRERGVTRCAFLLNCQPAAALKLCQLVDLPINDDGSAIEVWVDNKGAAGRAFSVKRGWLPDNTDMNPFLKLFGMLWGLGAWATLPAVIGGYLGNPFTPQPWIQDALAIGMKQGRWPDNALEIADNDSDGTIVIVKNKFDDLPLVGTWPRRPLELATLRLQSMLGVSLQHWKELAPDDEALTAGVLTQLGGCLIVEHTDNAASESATNSVYEWRDPGICAVANFEDMLKKL
jgi:AhpC/TSA antioxidant enzyme